MHLIIVDRVVLHRRCHYSSTVSDIFDLIDYHLLLLVYSIRAEARMLESTRSERIIMKDEATEKHAGRMK